jgi:hypothetical protein
LFVISETYPAKECVVSACRKIMPTVRSSLSKFKTPVTNSLHSPHISLPLLSGGRKVAPEQF